MNAFFSWQQAILKSSLEPTTKHVCLTIGVHMAGDGSGCFPSYNLIAEESGLGRRTVIDHVQKAVDAGYMTLHHRERDNGSSTSNLYQPTMPGVVQELHPGSAPPAPGVVQELHPHNNPSLTTQVTPPSGSPTKTKATTRESRGQRLEAYTGTIDKAHWVTDGKGSCPMEWAGWCYREFGWNVTKCCDVFGEFSNYWVSEAGQRARKLNWFATFKNRAKQIADRDGRGGRQSGPNSAAERNTRNLIADAEAWASIRAGGDTRQSGVSSGGNQPVGTGGDACNDGSDAVDVTGHVEHR